MDNQHKHIKGYRDLSAEEIALMNKIKTKAAECGELVAELGMLGGNAQATDVDLSATQGKPVLDQRWVSIGRTHLQEGFMALVRAVAQPTTF